MAARSRLRCRWFPSAKTAALTYTGGNVSGNTVTLQVAGNLGSTQLSFASGTSVTAIATAINGVKNATGLSAQVSGGDFRYYFRRNTGSMPQFASVEVISGTLKSNFSATESTGADANITVNGAAAEVAGLDASYRNSSLDVSFNINPTDDKPSRRARSTSPAAGPPFQLGSQVTENGRASIGIGSVSTGDLGDSLNGYLSSLGAAVEATTFPATT